MPDSVNGTFCEKCALRPLDPVRRGARGAPSDREIFCFGERDSGASYRGCSSLMRIAIAILAGLLPVALGSELAPLAKESREEKQVLAFPEVAAGRTFDSKDSLKCEDDGSEDAQACLTGLLWKPGEFKVSIEEAKTGFGDLLVRFPSPLPSGDATNDLVAMEWYVAKDAAGRAIKAPAMVVVHESGRGMVAGRAFARGLRNRGMHTFMAQLPGYGVRTSAFTMNFSNMLPGFRQAIGDVRRARDAAAVLPMVDSSLIGLHGTSLGGFVVATVAGLDRGYQKSFIMLAGGRLADVLLQGNRDAASLRRRLASVGVGDEEIKNLSQIIEPMRLAHRVDAAKTWLFSGKFDEVVPPECSHAYANAAKLGANHLVLPVGHYSAAMMFPMIVPKVAELMLAR
jgi:dienelactone hydrolase